MTQNLNKLSIYGERVRGSRSFKISREIKHYYNKQCRKVTVEFVNKYIKYGPHEPRFFTDVEM